MAPVENVLISFAISLQFVRPDLLQSKLSIPQDSAQMNAMPQAVGYTLSPNQLKKGTSTTTLLALS